MVWYFIGVYIINRTLHGRLQIRNFSSRIENIFQKLEEKFRISAWPCNILYLFQSSPFHLIVNEGSVKMSSFGSKFIVFVFGKKI